MQARAYFLQAKQAAEAYRGRCAPNPAVGAVLVSDGDVIAVGAHSGCGQPHAEVEALQQAGDRAAGAQLFVTLEPCCHYGRTPPCTEAIIAAGVTEVFYAYDDPNPVVAGKGAKRLEEAGVVCHYADVPEIAEMYRAYAHWVATGKPYVRAKLACSFDGKIALAGGQPAAISGEQAAQQTAQDRLFADAILTSVRTVIHDDPQFTARLAGTETKKPVWVMDARLEMPESARLWQTSDQLVLCHADTLSSEQLVNGSNSAAGLHAIPVDATGQLSWESVLSKMGEQGIHEVWVEAGGLMTESLLASGLLSELIVSMSPCVLGAEATAGFQTVQDLSAHSQSVAWQSLGETARCVIRY